VEFQAHIENQAIGWVYRALDARNYYLAKLEATQPGPEPPVVLARYAVIDGQLETRVETPLPMPLRRDALYKVRFEAVGGRYTTWVQDQKIAAWTDRRRLYPEWSAAVYSAGRMFGSGGSGGVVGGGASAAPRKLSSGEPAGRLSAVGSRIGFSAVAAGGGANGFAAWESWPELALSHSVRARWSRAFVCGFCT
jgi:hypothetical protein